MCDKSIKKNIVDSNCSMGICNTILSVNAVYKIANGQFNGNSNYSSYFVTYRKKESLYSLMDFILISFGLMVCAFI